MLTKTRRLFEQTLFDEKEYVRYYHQHQIELYLSMSFPFVKNQAATMAGQKKTLDQL